MSCLFVGALSDTLGRRPVVIGAALVFAASALAAMFASSMEELCLWRAVQGVCAAAGPVVTQAIVRDRWKGVQAAKLLSLIAVLFGVAPAISPVIGGWITVWFGWRGIFAFLALFNLLMGLSCFLLLPESLPTERRSAFRPAETARAYGGAFRNPAFVAGVAGHGLAFTGSIVYTAGGADFVENIIGMGPGDFAWFIFPLVGATMLGAAMVPWARRHASQRRIILWSAIGMTMAGVLGVASEWQGASSYPWVLAFPILYSFAMSVARPFMNLLNLDYFPARRGMAASIQQFFQTAGFALASAVLVPFAFGVAWKYSAVMVLCGLGVWALWTAVFRLRPAWLPKGFEEIL